MKRQCFDSTGIDAQRQALQDALERLDREAAERAASQAGSPALNRMVGAVPTNPIPVNAIISNEMQAPSNKTHAQTPVVHTVPANSVPNNTSTPIQTLPTPATHTGNEIVGQTAAGASRTPNQSLAAQPTYQLYQ